MKYLPIVAFSFCTILYSCNNANNNDTDIKIIEQPTKKTEQIVNPQIVELKQYSFVLIKRYANGNFAGDGTGFFLRYKSKLYFITNKHVAYENKPSSLHIGLKDGRTYNIFVRNHPQDSFTNKMLDNIDLAAFPIKENGISFPEVSDFVDLQYADKTPNEYVLWGYIGDTLNKSKADLHNTLFQGKYLNEDSLIRKNITYDSSKYTIIQFKNQFKKIHFFIPFRVYKGLSGSPVFGIFNKNGRKIVTFLGVVNLGLEGGKIGKGINAKTILDYLDDLNY